jgi:ethanolamine-phosphate phospho-lyase
MFTVFGRNLVKSGQKLLGRSSSTRICTRKSSTLTKTVSSKKSSVVLASVAGLGLAGFGFSLWHSADKRANAHDNLSKEEVSNLRKKHFSKCFKTFYTEPLMILEGHMQYVYDETGRQYLDAYNNVQTVGHSHPEVVKAAAEQMAKLNVNSRYLHPNIVHYAQKLTAKFPEKLSVVFFVNSASEANDLALQLAKAYTGHKDVIVNDNAYHGTTIACVEMSPNKWYSAPHGNTLGQHTHVVNVPDTFRGAHRDWSTAGHLYANEIADVISKVKQQGRDGVAAFFAESIQGCGGQIPLPPNYLKEVYEHVRKAGGVCVADEVQVGFGRSGDHFWAFESQDVIPDIVTLGKPIGNGFPLGAVVTTPEIAASFDKKEYFNTYGGNPVACAVGLAVLDVLEKEKLQDNAKQVGDYLKEQLQELKKKRPMIGDVRGLGLFLGVELVRDKDLTPADAETHVVVEEMKNRGVLTALNGPYENVLRIKPPLCFNKSNADQFVKTLDEVLEWVEREQPHTKQQAKHKG